MAAKAPQVRLNDLPASAVMHLMGNGMSVPVAGALILITLLHVQKQSAPRPASVNRRPAAKGS